jgi:hypothetical protein
LALYHTLGATIPATDPEYMKGVLEPRPAQQTYTWEKKDAFNWPGRLSQYYSRLLADLNQKHQNARTFGVLNRIREAITDLSNSIDLGRIPVDAVSNIPRYLKLFWGRDKQYVNTAREIKDVLMTSTYQTLTRLGNNSAFKLQEAVSSSEKTLDFCQFLEIPFSERTFKMMTSVQLETLRTQVFTRRTQVINAGGPDPEVTEAAIFNMGNRGNQPLLDLGASYYEAAGKLAQAETPVCPVTISTVSFKDLDSYLRYLILMHWQRVFGYSKKKEQEKIAKDRVLRFLNRDTVQINKLVTTFGGKPMTGKFIETSK